MKRKGLLKKFFLLAFSAILLAGCGTTTRVYDDVKRPSTSLPKKTFEGTISQTGILANNLQINTNGAALYTVYYFDDSATIEYGSMQNWLTGPLTSGHTGWVLFLHRHNQCGRLDGTNFYNQVAIFPMYITENHEYAHDYNTYISINGEYTSNSNYLRNVRLMEFENQNHTIFTWTTFSPTRNYEPNYCFVKATEAYTMALGYVTYPVKCSTSSDINIDINLLIISPWYDKQDYLDYGSQEHNDGYSQGYDDGEADGYADGYSQGYDDGEAHGYADGYSEAYADTWLSMVGLVEGIEYSNFFVQDGMTATAWWNLLTQYIQIPLDELNYEDIATISNGSIQLYAYYTMNYQYCGIRLSNQNATAPLLEVYKTFNTQTYGFNSYYTINNPVWYTATIEELGSNYQSVLDYVFGWRQDSTAYTRGYSEGREAGIEYANAMYDEQSLMMNNIFSAVFGIPISVLNGISSLTIWSVPLIGIIFSVLMLLVTIWVIKKFI